ncbi:anti-sigma factor [Patiriisocius marinus]|uniref:anti-sigma factor n=1 Tax=Patiriisocius marinus TaxID=1397112 RepID=UPI00232DA0FC|nr:anti-sigma factor [Patiriisocius marinus]
MTPQELITSGILELYVCGALADEEHKNITAAINTNAEVKREVENIEQSLMELSKNTAPVISNNVWARVLATIRPVRNLQTNRSTNWPAITGWAAAIICLGGIFWMLNQNGDLKENILLTKEENTVLKEKINEASKTVLAHENVLEILRSKDFNTIVLPGNQAVAPQAFSKVLYNKTDAVAYIDVKGLPKAPEGKVYQVWSLVLDPLTPTSIGLIDVTSIAGEDLYKFNTIPAISQAFGITLEPAGGSESPTLSQLYTLGTVAP